MAKKASKKTLKAKAWKIFSEYIRRKASDYRGLCACVTCGKEDHWKNMQAGHAVGGRTNAILFREDVVHVQCPGCNVFKHGNYNRYSLFMIDKYGRDHFEYLLSLKNKPMKLTEQDLEDIIEKYTWSEDED